MSDYYYDEDRGVAYKVDPIRTSVVHDEGNSTPRGILVHTDVKVTNCKREKVRRTISEFFPSERYDLDSAKKVFSDILLTRFISGAKRISEEEYQSIKSKFEV